MDLWVLAVCACGCNCVGGRAVRRTFSPSSASSPVSGLCLLAHVLCMPEDPASLTLARDVTGISKLARDCDRSELRPHLPKLRLVEQEPKIQNIGKNVPTAYVLKGYLKRCTVLGSAPCALGATALSSRENLTATKRCGTTTPTNTSDGRSGYCAPLLLDNSGKPARKNERREKRRREHTTERQARRPSRGSWNVTPAA